MNSTVHPSVPNRSRLDGRRALVTGAAVGIGQEVARELAARGARVVVHHSGSDPSETLALLAAQGSEGTAIKADLSRPEQCARLVQEAADALGGLDLLVNNAGVSVERPIELLDVAEFDMLFNVNVRATYLCTRAAIEVLTEAGGGSIVNMSSVHSFAGLAPAAAYAATKGAINAFTRTVAMEVIDRRIRVNAVAPGLIETPRYFTEARTVPYSPEWGAGIVPWGLTMRPEEPVILASYLTLAGDVIPEVRPGNQISPFDIATRIEAAQAAGYRGMGFGLPDLDHWGTRHGAGTIRRWIDGAGIDVVELEMLHDWYHGGARKASSDAMADRLMEWASALGARHLKVGTGFTGEPVGRSRLADSLAELGTKAADLELMIALEPMPMAIVRTPDEGLAIIEDAGVANVGLLIDSWHVYRAGVDYESLRRIPAHRIASLEVIDGGAQPFEGDLVLDSINHRRLAGHGEFDIDHFLSAVLSTGYRGPIGDENISIENRARTLQAAAHDNHDAVLRAVQRARALAARQSVDDLPQ